jgi:hypothetical protein
MTRECPNDQTALRFVTSWSETYGRGARQRGVKLWVCLHCAARFEAINGGPHQETQRRGPSSDTQPAPILRKRSRVLSALRWAASKVIP